MSKRAIYLYLLAIGILCLLGSVIAWQVSHSPRLSLVRNPTDTGAGCVPVSPEIRKALSTAPPRLNQFSKILFRVLGDKQSPLVEEKVVSRFEIFPDGIKVHTGVGDYTFKLGQMGVGYAQGLPSLQIFRGRVSAPEVVVYPEDGPRTEGVIRSVFRADPYVHPYLLTFDAAGQPRFKLQPSPPQREALEFLKSLEKGKYPHGVVAGLVMPTGLGKTATAALHVSALSQRLGEPVNVIFTVENERILEGALETFGRELKIPTSRRIGLYGEQTQTKIPNNVRMVAVTRSTYFNRKDRIHELIQNGKPWVIFIDEGHHAESSQYNEIRTDLEQYMGPKTQIILLSATLWRSDAVHLVRDLLQGHVYGALLTPEEQHRLRTGDFRDIQELSRLQLKRAMSEGYLTALHRLEIVQHVRGEDADESAPFIPRQDGEDVFVLEALMADLKQRVGRAGREPIEALVFVETTAIADEMAKRWGEGAAAYHSKQPRSVAQSTLNAFKREGGVLFVVDALNEGVDIPEINLIVFLRNTDSLRILLQNVGRGSRMAKLKTDLSVIDYTGNTRFLVDELPDMMVARGPSLPTPGEPRSELEDEGKIVVANREFTPEGFRQYYRELFPDDDFLIHHPTYDSEVFAPGGLGVLQEMGGKKNGFSERTKTRFFEEQIIQKLPEELRAKAQEKLLDLQDRDGGNATRGQQPNEVSRRRIYEAFVRICEVWNRHQPEGGACIDISTVHTAEGMRVALGTLGVLSVSHGVDLSVFATEGLGVLREVGGRINGFSARTKTIFFEEQIIQKLPEELRAEAQEKLLSLQDSDGLEATSETRPRGSSRRRIYEAFVGICEMWNRHQPEDGARIDISTVHTAEGMRAALSTLGVLSTSHGVDLEVFATGGLGVLRKVGGAMTGFTNRTKTRFFEEQIVQKLPGEFRAEAQEKLLGLQDRDGSAATRTTRPNESSRRRIYEAFVGICEVWNRHQPEDGARISISTVHTAEGMRSALRILGITPQ